MPVGFKFFFYIITYFFIKVKRGLLPSFCFYIFVIDTISFFDIILPCATLLIKGTSCAGMQIEVLLPDNKILSSSEIIAAPTKIPSPL